jgi:hypothetical protein
VVYEWFAVAAGPVFARAVGARTAWRRPGWSVPVVVVARRPRALSRRVGTRGRPLGVPGPRGFQTSRGKVDRTAESGRVQLCPVVRLGARAGINRRSPMKRSPQQRMVFGWSCESGIGVTEFIL